MTSTVGIFCDVYRGKLFGEDVGFVGLLQGGWVLQKELVFRMKKMHMFCISKQLGGYRNQNC